MKNIAYDAVQAALRKWTSKAGASRAAFYKKNSDFGSLPAYRSIKKYEKVGRMLGIKTPFSVRSAAGLAILASSRAGKSSILPGATI